MSGFAGFSDRSRMRLKFTANEGKPHALMVFFSLSFPRKRESRDFHERKAM